MDILHLFAQSPLQPAYRAAPRRASRPRRDAAAVASASTAAWSRSATTATASPSTTRSRATRSGSSRSSWPTGWSPTASGWRSWPTAATRGPSSGSPTAGRWCRPRAGGAALLGARRTDGWQRHRPCTACARSIPPRRSATSASTRPTPTPAGPARACPPRRSGSTPPGACRSTATSSSPAACTPAARRRARACGRCSATSGNGPAAPICPTPASARRPARSASTTASSWPASSCCAAALRHAAGPRPRPATATSSTRSQRWMFSGLRLALDGAGAGGPRVAATSQATCWRASRKPQKAVPPKYFYDAEGSRLFEAITELAEYYPTRTEIALLRGAAGRRSPPHISPRRGAGRVRLRRQHQDPHPAGRRAADRRLRADRHQP